MNNIKHLFDRNRSWAQAISKKDPEFFLKLSKQQRPEYLWIGCSDSRVPANEIVDLLPGELFVHRNIANVVVHTDLNCLSVMQFAVDVLKVKHIIVCGHYGCNGIRAAYENQRIGLSDNWLRHVADVKEKHESRFHGIKKEACSDRLSELNVIEQVLHVCETTIVQDAWIRKQDLAVHGWIYGIQNGLLKDLNITIASSEETPSAYQKALQTFEERK
jgi:carbonic anhydrase